MQCIVIGEDDSRMSDVSCPTDGYLNVLPLEGTFSYSLDDVPFFVEVHQNIVQQVASGQVLHLQSSVGTDKAILFFIPQSSFPEILPIIDNRLLYIKDNSHLKLIKERVAEIHQTSHLLKGIRIQSLLLEALAVQLGCSAQHQKPRIQPALLQKMMQAQTLIEQDLSKSYTISEIAKAVGTNEQYLKKFFKQYSGKTVANYALDARMRYAKKLILNGDVRIEDVSRMTGYKHPSHFSMSFKKFFGVLPSDFRHSLSSSD